MAEPTIVYLVWHPGESDPYEGPLFLGAYSTRQRAESRIAEATTKPGFRDHPEAFEISECVVDRDEWPEGFVTYQYKLRDDDSPG